jgi:ABC-type cobalamin/Fe3+-siderophores transport system ATPase subunit
VGESLMIAEARGLVVEHRGVNLVGPIDIAIAQGDFWGIVGPNGAGKSSLLRAIAGLEPISAGSLELAGRVDRRSIGLLFQHHDFVPELPLTVADVVGAGRAARVALGPLRSAEDRRAVDDALELLGLDAMEGRLYRELSGGERQKVQLARLVAQGADLLLLDEPAAGLDLDWQERLNALVADLHRATGVAVVMVTHEVHHLPPCCDRVLLLREGRGVARGAPAEVFTAELLSELYGCRMEVGRRGGRFFAHSLGPAGEEG